MLNAEWVECILDMKDRISGKKFGIAYTASFFGNPKEIWYDRLSTDVPKFVAEALRKLDADFIFLSVEDVTSLCESPEKSSQLAGVFNVCLGHKSLDNWTLVPAAVAWCNIPVFPNGAHATVLGEDKVTSRLFAKANRLQIADDWGPNDGWVQKPRGLGSSDGIEFHTRKPEQINSWFVEKFVPGADVTATFLYNPATNNVEFVGALLVSHEESTGYASMWTKDKKSQGTARYKVKKKRLVRISAELEGRCLQLAEQMCMRTAFRIDFRYPGDEPKLFFKLTDLYFLEINPTPTLSAEGSFGLTVREALSLHNESAQNIIWPNSDYEALAIASMILSVPNKTAPWS